MSEQLLIEAFRASEIRHSQRLSANPAAANEPAELIRAHVKALATATDVKEFHCSMKGDWDSVVFHALLKRYGIRPYRYRKQRGMTILVRVSEQLMNETLWPIFQDVREALWARFTEVTRSLLPAIASGPFSMAILDHDHSAGEMCDNCQRRLLET